jgi:ribosomal protein S18 acetylase RimI-like enzyme
MRADEYPAWRAAHIDWYARDLAENGSMAVSAARRKAIADMESVLPLGLETPDHSLLVVEVDGARVGSVWFAVRDEEGVSHAYLFAVEITPTRRGEGFGREAMEAFEDEVRARGLRRISLNVFGGNERARSLYRALGFSESSVHMDKDLI